MCKVKQLVPKRRFAGFTDAWEQRKFSEITYPAGEKNRENLPLESYSITNEHGFIPQDEKFGNGGTMREADKRMYYIVSPNSFAYNPARINVGSIGYQNTSKNVIVSSLYEVFKTTEDVDDRLLWHWFKSPNFHNLIIQLQEGGVRLYFYYDKLCMGEVALPKVEEQRKIGQFFDSLDNLIALHQLKLEKAKEFKKSCLVEMFPAEDQRKPKRRFPGFTDFWERRKLSDVVYRVSEKSVEIGLPRVEYEDINSGQGTLNKNLYEKNSTKQGVLFKENDVLFGKLRPYLKNWLFAGFSGIAVGDFWVLRNDKNDNSFVYSLIQTSAFDVVANQSTGTKMPRADWNLVSNTVFMFPNSTKEQHQTGNFFLQLDTLITLHQRKLDKLKAFKQACLNEMFV